MDGGVTAAPPPEMKSLLYKPLNELTEEDISQLTREDCRRYLKEQGMRRPSWNKSQAIQQVICLKSLLEPLPSPPNAAATTPRPPITLTVNSNSSSSVKEQSPADADGSVSALGEDGGLNQLEGPSGSDPIGEGECYQAIINSKSRPNRCKNASNAQFDQMTILCSGKVNVYDGVPVDKQAHTILHLAASPIHFRQDEPKAGNLENFSSSCPLSSSAINLNVSTSDSMILQQMLTGKMVETVYCRSEGNSSHEQDTEGQSNRQASLQRYFEKRKDRGKFKIKKKSGSSSSGLEMYLSHQMRASAIKGQNADSNISNTSQLKVPQTADESKEKHPMNHGLSVDLNDKV